MKNTAQECIRRKLGEIKQNDKDNWNIAYGMISLAHQLNLITYEERTKFLGIADHAYFWGSERSKNEY